VTATAPRAETPRNVLRRLAALGASLECRGDKLVLRAGTRPVPAELIQSAREAKAELWKMLNRPKILSNNEDEHLRYAEAETPCPSAYSAEGAQPIGNEHLREHVKASDTGSDFREVRGDQVLKALSEDAPLSPFDEDKGFCGVRPNPASKALNPPRASTFGLGERPPTDCYDTMQEANAGIVPRAGSPEISNIPLLLRDGRRLWRFSGDQTCATDGAEALINQANSFGAVLVADGLELIVVERSMSHLPLDLLCELCRLSGEVIAALRRQSRTRTVTQTPASTGAVTRTVARQA
jgi:hypothetical protein